MNEEPHVCAYCGALATYQLKNGKWCCQTSFNKCPAIRKKNSSGVKSAYSDGVHSPGTKGKPAWNKGLTKETHPSIARGVQVRMEGFKTGRLKPSWLGRHHTPEQIEKFRLAIRKVYFGKSIWRTQIEKRRSYAEQYFATIFTDAKQQYHVSRYFLDFAWPNKKVYVEVDGAQHYNDPGVVAHDVERTKNLEECGWRCIARIRWSLFKRMKKEQQESFVANIKSLIESTNP